MDVDTKRLRELLYEFGDEPWEAAGEYVRTRFSGEGGWKVADCTGLSITRGANAAMLIAALRNALPAMLDTIDALRAQLAEHAQDAIEREQELRRSIERNDGLRDELDALRARVEAAPIKTVEESGWGDESGDGRIYSLPDEMIGQRVALVKLEDKA